VKRKLAICVPVWNCLAYTKGFVNSIKTRYPFDLIVHANGCTDGTLEWLSNPKNFEGLKNLESVRVSFSETNLGCAKGANKTYRKAYETPDVTHIIYANNDILLRPDTLDNLVWAWDNRDPRMKIISGEGFHVETFGDELKTLKAFSSHNIYPLKLRFGACYCLFCWDKKAIEDIGLLDENFEFAYFDDNDHAETILEKGFLLSHFSGAPFFHYGSMSMKQNHVDNTDSFIRNKNYYFRKHNVLEIDPCRRFPEAVKAVEDLSEKMKGVTIDE